jgi:hypothetical protein
MDGLRVSGHRIADRRQQRPPLVLANHLRMSVVFAARTFIPGLFWGGRRARRGWLFHFETCTVVSGEAVCLVQ